MTDQIIVTPYDPAWPARFRIESQLIHIALADLAPAIEHIGSTAVPGLAAKPVIDIQVSVPDVEREEAFRAPIEAEGFGLRWIEPDHRYFRPPPPLPRLYQVHVCTIGSDWERRHLLFRDYLRTHPEVAAEYAQLKRAIAERYNAALSEHSEINAGYTDYKTDFIEATKTKARAEGSGAAG